MDPLAEHLAQRVAGAVAAVDALRSQLDVVERLARAVSASLAEGGCLFTCGNGGSAAQAAHLAEELTGKYRCVRPPLRAVCLCADAAALTCIANDFGYERVFSRQLEALARRGDALLVLSTSGH
ncbi:MAG: SIS domain-containing protein, partial [Planctomycetota bacterium]